MDLSPIAFFAYNRPEHTQNALTSLAAGELAPESHLHIFCDGPRSRADEEAVQRVREVARSQPWCGQVEVTCREHNLGLAASIITGVTDLCATCGRVIVVEDDLILAPGFLPYMNAALEAYQAAEPVMQVSGYMFPVALTAPTDAVFLPFTTTWGWATWQRAWRHFDAEMSGYETLKHAAARRQAFDLYGTQAFFDMLERQRAGKIDSWGIRWYLTTFLLGGLTLHPLQSLVQNCGFDASGTHCGGTSPFAQPTLAGRITRFPSRPQVDEACFRKILVYLREAGGQKRPWWKRLRPNVLRFGAN